MNERRIGRTVYSDRGSAASCGGGTKEKNVRNVDLTSVGTRLVKVKSFCMGQVKKKVYLLTANR